MNLRQLMLFVGPWSGGYVYWPWATFMVSICDGRDQLVLVS